MCISLELTITRLVRRESLFVFSPHFVNMTYVLKKASGHAETRWWSENSILFLITGNKIDCRMASAQLFLVQTRRVSTSPADPRLIGRLGARRFLSLGCPFTPSPLHESPPSPFLLKCENLFVSWRAPRRAFSPPCYQPGSSAALWRSHLAKQIQFSIWSQSPCESLAATRNMKLQQCVSASAPLHQQQQQ